MLRDKKSESLILHFGRFPLNKKWSYTNNRDLMRYENSFEIKSLAFLKHQFTRAAYRSIKKLALLNQNFNNEIENIHQFIKFFVRCEEIELTNFALMGHTIIQLPLLKIFAIKDCYIDTTLILDCLLLDVLIYLCISPNEVIFNHSEQLKYLECRNLFSTNLKLNGKFISLECLNLMNYNNKLRNFNLLNLMPNLKKLIIYKISDQFIKYLQK